MPASDDDASQQQSTEISAEEALSLAARLFAVRADEAGDRHDAVMGELVQHLAAAARWERTDELATEYTEALTKVHQQAQKLLIPRGLDLLYPDAPPEGRTRTKTMRALIEVAKVWRVKLLAANDGAELDHAARGTANVLVDLATTSIASTGTDLRAAESRLAERLRKKNDADAEKIALWALEECGMRDKVGRGVRDRARARAKAKKSKK